MYVRILNTANKKLLKQSLIPIRLKTELPSDDNDESVIKLPSDSEPLQCCMSNCSECVWQTYAAELAEQLKGKSETAKQHILDQIKDQNLKEFLKMELRKLDKIDKDPPKT